MTTASQARLWRTLVRVVSVDEQNVLVVLPSWDAGEHVFVRPRSIFPAELQAKLSPGLRCFAQVNKGADRAEDIVFADFETTTYAVAQKVDAVKADA